MLTCCYARQMADVPIQAYTVVLFPRRKEKGFRFLVESPFHYGVLL